MAGIPTVPISYPPNSKPPIHSKCKILDVISKPLTFAANSAFLGVMWGPVHNLEPTLAGIRYISELALCLRI